MLIDGFESSDYVDPNTTNPDRNTYKLVLAMNLMEKILILVNGTLN